MNLNSYIYENEPTYKKHLFTLENILKFIYILLVSFEYHVCRLGMAASILGAIRRKSIKTEFTMNILYLINIYQFKCTNNYMYHLPIMIHYVIGIAEYLNIKQGALYEKFKSFVTTMQNTKEFFMDFRCKYELALLPLSVLMVIVSESSWWLVILHTFYVITKIVASEQMLNILKQYKKSLSKTIIQLKQRFRQKN